MIFNWIYDQALRYLPSHVSLVITVILLFVIAALITAFIPIAFGWVDRKLSARIQSRYGPIYVGKFGLLQNFADIVKLLGKDLISNQYVDKFAYNLAPIVSATLPLLIISIIPLGSPSLILINLPSNLLFIYILMAVSPFVILIGGWGSNNKFAMLGAFRGSAQMLAYELSVFIVFMSVGFLSGSYDISSIVSSQHYWNVLILPLSFIVFLIASLAIIERGPFDLPESTQEFQAGWKIEYSGLRYGLFLISDYVRLFVVAMLITYLFFGGWLGPYLPPFIWFWIKTLIVLIFIMSLRWALNRPRIDQLISMGWKWLVPLSIINFVVVLLI